MGAWLSRKPEHFFVALGSGSTWVLHIPASSRGSAEESAVAVSSGRPYERLLGHLSKPPHAIAVCDWCGALLA